MRGHIKAIVVVKLWEMESKCISMWMLSIFFIIIRTGFLHGPKKRLFLSLYA